MREGHLRVAGGGLHTLSTGDGQVPWHVGDGAALPPVVLTTIPKVVWPSAATWPFQSALRTVTAEPDWLSVPFQTLAIVWPAGSVQPTCQCVYGVVPWFITVTVAW